MAKSKEIVEEKNIQGQEGLLTAKEARSEIARVLLSKYNEITEIKNDKTLSEDEKNEKIAKIHDFMDVVQGKKDPSYLYDGRNYRSVSEEEKSEFNRIESLAEGYRLSYVKRFQIKELEKTLKATRDPEKKHDLERKLEALKNTKLRPNTRAIKYKDMEGYHTWNDVCESNPDYVENPNKHINELCEIAKKNGLCLAHEVDNDGFDYDIFEKLSKENRKLFIDAVIEGGGIFSSNRRYYIIDELSKYLPQILEGTGGLKEGASAVIYGDLNTIKKIVESIKKTGGLKEGCDIWFDSKDYYKLKELMNDLKEDANEKGINCDLRRSNGGLSDDPTSHYKIGYGSYSNEAMEAVKEKEKNKNIVNIDEYETEKSNKLETELRRVLYLIDKAKSKLGEADNLGMYIDRDITIDSLYRQFIGGSINLSELKDKLEKLIQSVDKELKNKKNKI